LIYKKIGILNLQRCKLLYPKEYSNYFGIEYNNKKQLLKEKILLCVKHSNDKTYDELLNLIVE